VHIGYRGPITFESFSSAVLAPDLTNALCIWRDLWTDSEDLARHARQFIAAQLKGISTTVAAAEDETSHDGQATAPTAKGVRDAEPSLR
jgi:hypothetical protein